MKLNNSIVFNDIRFIQKTYNTYMGNSHNEIKYCNYD